MEHKTASTGRPDPRNIKDKTFQTQCIHSLVQFLLEHGYNQAISPKILTAPSSKDFFMIFQFLINQLDPNFQYIQQKPEEDCPAIFKLLKFVFLCFYSLHRSLPLLCDSNFKTLNWYFDLTVWYCVIDEWQVPCGRVQEIVAFSRKSTHLACAFGCVGLACRVTQCTLWLGYNISISRSFLYSFMFLFHLYSLFFDVHFILIQYYKKWIEFRESEEEDDARIYIEYLRIAYKSFLAGEDNFTSLEQELAQKYGINFKFDHSPISLFLNSDNLSNFSWQKKQCSSKKQDFDRGDSSFWRTCTTLSRRSPTFEKCSSTSIFFVLLCPLFIVFLCFFLPH